MEEKVLKEVKQIKILLSQLIGTSEQPAQQKFSKEAIAKAAKEFRNLAIQRGEWVSRHDIDSVIRNAPWDSGKIIIEKFGFTNYFVRGKTTYFNRKDLAELGKELKKRKIDLKKYVELVNDKEKFQKYVDGIILPKGRKKRKNYRVPEHLQDIFSKPYSPPDEQMVRDV